MELILSIGVVFFVVVVIYFILMADIDKSYVPPIFEYICANCGAMQKSRFSHFTKQSCVDCSSSELIPTTTPRGRELNELYHGSTSIEERLRTAHEGAKKLVVQLEGAVPSNSIADELEKLALLIQNGALSRDEWVRAKDLILGQPKDKQADAIERVAKLYKAHQIGALTQSEFNITKWDILSRVGKVN